MANVLIVDDAAFMRMMMKNMLEKNGFTVVGEAANGNEALEQFKALNPDIVTLDITMPEKDGLTALKEIRQLDPNSKIIMASAMGQQNMVIEAVQAGAVDFVVKPFEESRVVEALKKVVG
ncbi:response regulator [Alicyclobacillus sp. SO9]|uniref:response regulator n=1 Tax=Alicyclobacillus sp. SO9 TaxID=2665646 RepID=UPI0018E8E231|nr:response regulator [Alicyclobacillus sp. SO9]QQE79269.1 response regulator [Alicyclobacillus sp. SO9]